MVALEAFFFTKWKQILPIIPESLYCIGAASITGHCNAHYSNDVHKKPALWISSFGYVPTYLVAIRPRETNTGEMNGKGRNIS